MKVKVKALIRLINEIGMNYGGPIEMEPKEYRVPAGTPFKLIAQTASGRTGYINGLTDRDYVFDESAISAFPGSVPTFPDSYFLQIPDSFPLAALVPDAWRDWHGVYVAVKGEHVIGGDGSEALFMPDPPKITSARTTTYKDLEDYDRFATLELESRNVTEGAYSRQALAERMEDLFHGNEDIIWAWADGGVGWMESLLDTPLEERLRIRERIIDFMRDAENSGDDEGVWDAEELLDEIPLSSTDEEIRAFINDELD